MNEYIENQKCNVWWCPSPKHNYNNYCINHRCQNDRCTIKRLSGKRYCFAHTPRDPKDNRFWSCYK